MALFVALTRAFAHTPIHKFLIPWARLGKLRAEAYDDELGDKVWAWLQEQVQPFRA